MTWHFLMTQCDGQGWRARVADAQWPAEHVLEPGRHRLFDLRNELTVEVFNVVKTEITAERYAVIKAARPDLAAELFELVETKANEIAIVSLDGRPAHLLAPWQVRVYWKVATSCRCRAHRRDRRCQGQRASPCDDRAQPLDRRDGSGGREPRGRSALCRGPARGAARARSARLLDRRPQDRGQAPRPASAGGRDHRAGDADQGSHRAAGDA